MDGRSSRSTCRYSRFQRGPLFRSLSMAGRDGPERCCIVPISAHYISSAFHSLTVRVEESKFIPTFTTFRPSILYGTR